RVDQGRRRDGEGRQVGRRKTGGPVEAQLPPGAERHDHPRQQMGYVPLQHARPDARVCRGGGEESAASVVPEADGPTWGLFDVSISPRPPPRMLLTEGGAEPVSPW